jgi:hypothetical protein
MPTPNERRLFFITCPPNPESTLLAIESNGRIARQRDSAVRPEVRTNLAGGSDFSAKSPLHSPFRSIHTAGTRCPLPEQIAVASSCQHQKGLHYVFPYLQCCQRHPSGIPATHRSFCMPARSLHLRGWFGCGSEPEPLFATITFA